MVIVLVAPDPVAVTAVPTKLRAVANVDNEEPSSCTVIPLIPLPPPPPPPNTPVGNRSESMVPVPILEALRTGILAESMVPVTISEALRTGILAESNVPEVIFDVGRLGIAEGPRAATNAASTSAVIIDETLPESTNVLKSNILIVPIIPE